MDDKVDIEPDILAVIDRKETVGGAQEQLQ
jgi:hypothetical protein